jgi:choline monooxygenase
MNLARIDTSEIADIDQGFGLPSRFYVSPEIFAIERREIFAKTWQFGAHRSEIAAPRSYTVAKIGEFEVLITCDQRGENHAMRNVCIHRGAQLVDCAGHNAVLRCPYHSWSYELDGRLRAAPGFEQDPRIKPGESRLVQVKFETFGPLIFVNVNGGHDSVSQVIAPISDVAAPWSDLKFHETRRYAYDCNWKIALENSLECYHCPVLHPGFNSLIDTQNYSCEIYEFCAIAGGTRRGNVHRVGNRIYASATEEGASDVQTYFIWPNLWLLTYPGPANLVVARWFPDGIDRSYCLRSFYFGDDFLQEKRAEFIDYVELIQKQDLKICAEVYRNICSGAFERGYLRFGGGGLTEELILHFQKWFATSLNRTTFNETV